MVDECVISFFKRLMRWLFKIKKLIKATKKTKGNLYSRPLLQKKRQEGDYSLKDWVQWFSCLCISFYKQVIEGFRTVYDWKFIYRIQQCHISRNLEMRLHLREMWMWVRGGPSCFRNLRWSFPRLFTFLPRDRCDWRFVWSYRLLIVIQ